MKIDVKEIDKDKIFFTSDPHFYHTNIIKYCERPFDIVEDMNNELLEKWNDTIGEDDTIFMLGDFSMKANAKQIAGIIGKLKGRKHLILGNHDRSILTNGFIGSQWKSINDITKITVVDDEVDGGYQPIIMCHYPMITWDGSHRGSWQLFGHVHGGLSNKGIIKHSPNQLDVGVDCHDFYPISYEEVKILITKQNLNKK